MTCSVSSILKMALDLTFFNKKHENSVQYASKKVQEFLKSYEEEQCCAQCEVYQKYTVPVSDMTKVKYAAIHDMMGAMFYSSGFWSNFASTKHKNVYKVTLWLKAMTTEEKEKALFIPDKGDV